LNSGWRLRCLGEWYDRASLLQAFRQKKIYQIVRTFATDGRQKPARFLARKGQLWLPPVLDLM